MYSCRALFLIVVRIAATSLVLSPIIAVDAAFSGVLFQEAPTRQRTAPSESVGVDIELPNFDELFGRIQQVSPLCRLVMTQDRNRTGKRGFAGIVDDSITSMDLDWQTVESNPRAVIHQIEKIDRFNGHAAPILRFRSSLTGPCIGECFANFIMDLEERKKWDTQIHNVKELYPINDLDHANIAMGFGRYGDCSRLGIGHCQTKAGFGVSPREQLTLCGIQDFVDDGSCVIWGTELCEWHNHLFPPGERHTRAKSHLFATTLTPTSDRTFDVEYVLQLEIGGKIPTWLTTPIVTDSVKKLFQEAEQFFKNSSEGSRLDKYLKEKAESAKFANYHALLMTP